MNFLSSLSSAVLSASSAALNSAQGGVPNVPGYQLGERVHSYDAKSIWTLWTGTKKVRRLASSSRGGAPAGTPTSSLVAQAAVN